MPRLDAPGALHHVIGRGINGVKIFDIADAEEKTKETLRLSLKISDYSGKKDGLFWCGCCAFSRYKHFCC